MLFRARIRLSRAISPVDIFLFVGICALLYALVGVAKDWASPFRPKTEIDLSLVSLLGYSFYSLVRVCCGYLLSLGFTLTYGYVAAKSRVAEPLLISLLDILQSVPVLGFMPGLVLALVNLFPRSNFGLELAAIVMIFTGQGWNMVFSFYSSLKSVPGEIREVTRHFGLRKWFVLRTVELPFAANGLLWNSMMSMAGGWFFLMVIESFTLGDKDFRLPGIGSYMATAYEKGDSGAVVAGILVMFVLIVMVDRCLWAPLVVWSERFKYDRDERVPVPRSLVLDWLNRSNLPKLTQRLYESVRKAAIRRLDEHRRHRRAGENPWMTFGRLLELLRWPFAALGVVVFVYGLKSMYSLVAATPGEVWVRHLGDTGLTFLRVMAATLIGAAWTIPVGVFIGTHPVWTRRLQPVVQVVASFPAPMLFPLLTGIFLWAGLPLDIGAVILMAFASQWYILFNVIAGATLIPHHMIDLADVFGVRGFHYWKSIILPAIFPSLVNGLITAAGGAWNASIVAEYVRYRDVDLYATGIGASITRAAAAGDYPSLAGGVLVMVTTVVVLNRLFWGSLYRLAETRFRLES